MGNCDIPPSVLYRMGDKVNELAPDVLFWTGDVPPHDQWNYNWEQEQRYQNFLNDYMVANLTWWSTYPLEGNHDFAQVINSLDFDSKTPDPTITLLAEKWNIYLDEDSVEQFTKNGCYVQTMKTSAGETLDNVKVIAINSEASYSSNFYLISNRNDPGGILEWLEATLLDMEANDQIAVLIGHSPLNDTSQLSGWAKRFQALMERFQHIVRLSFYGHVHEERMSVDASISTGKPVHINLTTGALTTFTQAYPSFRKYIVDKQTMLPLKVETWTLDPNAEYPSFELNHELTDYYNITNLSPANIAGIADSMLNDSELAMKYLNTKYQNGLGLLTECDD